MRFMHSLTRPNLMQERNRELSLRKERIAQQLGVEKDREEILKGNDNSSRNTSTDTGASSSPQSVDSMRLPLETSRPFPADSRAQTSLKTHISSLHSDRNKQQNKHLVADINYKHVFVKAAVPMAIANTDGKRC